MLDDLLRWWAAQMLSLVPERFRRTGGGAIDALIVAADDGSAAGFPGFVVSSRRNGRETVLGRFTVDGHGVIDAPDQSIRAALGQRGRIIALRVAPSLLLERRLALPLAAERDLTSVLRYEMDRITPFAAEEVFWNWEIERRDRANGRLHVLVCLVPKASLAHLLGALERAGAAPTLLETADISGSARRIAVREEATGRERSQRRLLIAAAVVCGLLAAVAVSLPFVLQSMALAAVEERINELQPRVAQAEALRSRLAARAAGRDAIQAESARVGDVLEAVAAVTEILPDDTHLTALTLRQRQLTLNGLSTGAARLIAILSADPTVRNPAFQAPVTRSEAGHADLFSIRAEIAP
jgi:general secretion pathway protein L